MVCISYISYHSDSEQQEKKIMHPLFLTYIAQKNKEPFVYHSITKWLKFRDINLSS